MSASVCSARLRTYDNWQRGRQINTPFRTPTASVAATEPPERKGGGWAALVATAHNAYVRDRQMTTEERVEHELRKLAQRNKEFGMHESMSGSTAFSLPPTPEDFNPFDGILGGPNPPEDHETEKMVPSINYAVAELAKSLEDSRKALKKALKANEQLKRENEELRKENTRNQNLKVQLRKFDGWVSPDVHTELRQSWESWADVAEKKISSQQTKIGNLTGEYDALSLETKLKEESVAKLEERLQTYQNWTSPHERKVLDATLDMLNHKLSGVEGCRNCALRQNQTSLRTAPGVRKPLMGRQQTVA